MWLSNLEARQPKTFSDPMWSVHYSLGKRSFGKVRFLIAYPRPVFYSWFSGLINRVLRSKSDRFVANGLTK